VIRDCFNFERLTPNTNINHNVIPYDVCEKLRLDLNDCTNDEGTCSNMCHDIYNNIGIPEQKKIQTTQYHWSFNCPQCGLYSCYNCIVQIDGGTIICMNCYAYVKEQEKNKYKRKKQKKKEKQRRKEKLYNSKIKDQIKNKFDFDV
jgi:hypothetical protein